VISHGCVDGDGDGHGYGHGCVDGDGDGHGYGYGYGDGDGHGDGHGYGYGYGDGDGHGEYWSLALSRYQVPGAKIGLWLSDNDGRPCNGGSGTVARVGLVEEIPGPLQLCGPGALHATLAPHRWKGQRMWVVALHGEVIEQEGKMGALRREFVAELTG
jgi:hypothetical protein